MGRIDRYILGLYWTFFISSLLVFITLFLATDAMSSLVRFTNAEGSALIKYYLYYIPEIINRMLPIACVVGIVMTISTMNKGSELTALFAAGMSLFRVARFIFLSVIFISILGYLLSDHILPLFAREKSYIYYNEITKNPSKFQTIKTDRIWYRSKNTIFNIKALSGTGQIAQGLTLYFFDENWKLIQLITAKTVELNVSQWILHDGTLSVFQDGSSFPLLDEFKEKTISMTEDAQDLRNTGQTSDMLTQQELSKFISKNKDAGLDTIRYEVEYYSKFSYAFAGLVMSLLALPFLVGHSRSGGGVVKNIGVVLALVVSYWVLYSSSQTLGQHGKIPPLISAWGANIIMLLFSSYFLLRVRK